MQKKFFITSLYVFLCINIVFSKSILDVVLPKSFIDVVYNAKTENSLENVDKAIGKVSAKKMSQQLKQTKDGYNALHILMDIQNSNKTIESLLKKYYVNDRQGCTEFVNKSFPESFKVSSDITPLFYAIYKGDEKLTNILLLYGADVNKTFVFNKEKMSPLFYAVKETKSSIIDTLLKEPKIDMNFQFENEQGDTYTPLIQAIDNDDIKTVEKLLKYGANPNYPAVFYEVDEENTKWRISNCTPILRVKKSENSIGIIELLIKYGCDVSIGYNKYSSTRTIEDYSPVFKSIDDNDVKFFNLLEFDYKSQKLKIIDGMNFVEYTPLQYAITRPEINENIVDPFVDSERLLEVFKDKDNKKCKDVLLEREDISKGLRNRVIQIDTERKIFSAIGDCDYNALHDVLKNGASPDVYRDDKSALEYAVSISLETDGKSDINKIVTDLLEFKANPNKHRKEKSIFYSVVDSSLSEGLTSNKKMLLKLLLEYGADSSIIGEYDVPLIPYISEKENINFELLDFLLSDEIQQLEIIHRPSIFSFIRGGDYNNWNALCIAIKNNNRELLSYLNDKGADVNQKIYQDANNTFTPLGLACKQGSKECVEKLLELGASTEELQTMFGATYVTILMVACTSMPWDIVVRILDKSNSDKIINELDSLGKNAFMYASEFNKNPGNIQEAQKVMRNLRGRGAKIDKKTPTGDNALSLAINNGQTIETVLWLLSNEVPFEKKVSLEKLNFYKDEKEFDKLNELNSNLPE